MQPFFTWLLTIDSVDEDIRRRGRNVVIMALGLIVLALLFIPVILLQALQASTLVTIFVAIGMYAGVLLLARRGLVTLGALIFIGVEVLAVLGSSFSSHQLSIAPFYLVLSLLIASLSLRPWQIWPVLAFNYVGLLITILALPNNPLNEINGGQIVFGSILMLGIVALMSFLGARSTGAALNIAERARAEVEVAAAALSRANTSLEGTVAERTIALQTALEEVRARADEQSRLLAEVEQQRTTIRELSVPVIPISATTLIMPLVGALDSTRLMHVQEQALQALQRSAARYLVLDITGVPVVDTMVAQGLLPVVQAARLLGAEVMLVGVRPEVAQAIVGLGLDLRGMYTTSDLQSALSRIAVH